MEDTQSDIFNITKDQEKQKFILSHTYTDIFNKILIDIIVINRDEPP